MTQNEKTGLGIWRVKPVDGPHGFIQFQITRNDLPIGEPWIFKGQAVRAKTKMMREEGAAVRDAMRASYANSGAA